MVVVETHTHTRISSGYFKDVIPLFCGLHYTVTKTGSRDTETCWGDVVVGWGEGWRRERAKQKPSVKVSKTTTGVLCDRDKQIWSFDQTLCLS